MQQVTRVEAAQPVPLGRVEGRLRNAEEESEHHPDHGGDGTGAEEGVVAALLDEDDRRQRADGGRQGHAQREVPRALTEARARDH